MQTTDENGEGGGSTVALWDGTLTITIVSGEDLAIADLNSSDPYCVSQVSAQRTILGSLKTRVITSNLNPEWNECFTVSVYKCSTPIVVKFVLWDKDSLSADDFLGQHEVELPSTPDKCLLLDTQRTEKLEPRKNNKSGITIKGRLSYNITYTPGIYLTEMPYKYHNHKFTGLARSVGAGETARVYGTYQIQMKHIPVIFQDKWQHWNLNYDNAKKIFENPLIKSTVATQHGHLYSEVSITKKGTLKSGQDLLQLLKHGFKGGKSRFFTYSLNNDTWFFSETGASFFQDFTSKHAMHACVSENVRYAGEFHFQSNNEDSDGTDTTSYRLVIDNNSGTYSPDSSLLPSLKTLFEINFHGLQVEALDYKDPKLKQYKEALNVTPQLPPFTQSKRSNK